MKTKQSSRPPAPSGLHAQAGAVPFRRDGDALLLCLITDSRDSEWIFPKGMVDPGETPEETALKESWEEAGIRGRLLGDPLGAYGYSKGATHFWVRMFLLEIDEILTRWPEARWRRRRLCTPEEARTALGRAEHKRLLEAALRRLGLS